MVRSFRNGGVLGSSLMRALPSRTNMKVKLAGEVTSTALHKYDPERVEKVRILRRQFGAVTTRVGCPLSTKCVFYTLKRSCGAIEEAAIVTN